MMALLKVAWRGDYEAEPWVQQRVGGWVGLKEKMKVELKACCEVAMMVGMKDAL